MTVGEPTTSHLERTIQTPVGLARVRIHPGCPQPQPAFRVGSPGPGSLVLGHGAGGRNWSMDLIGLTTLSSSGWTVVLVEQPWRVAGRSVAPRPVVLDVAWSAVVADLVAGPEALPGPVICGGRSAGARVACRTATQVGAQAVIALAFPLHPPGRPGRSRADELVAVSAAGIPVLVVNGTRDAFGTPEQIRVALASAATGAGARGAVDVVSVEGGHGFTADPRDVVDAVRDWLPHR